MHEIGFKYTVIDGQEVEENITSFTITNRDLKEISKMVREGKITGKMTELPKKIQDKFYEAIRYDFEINEIVDYESYEPDFKNELPEDLLKLLPKDCQKILGYVPSEQPNEEPKEEEAKPANEEEQITYIGDDGQPDSPEWGVTENGEHLYLVIKKVYLDKIVKGTKQIEYREIKDKTYKRYIEVDEDGVPFWEKRATEGLPRTDMDYLFQINRCPYIPKDIRYLDLAAGYNKDRDTAVVELGGIGFDAGYGENGDLCWIIKFFIKRVVEYKPGK